VNEILSKVVDESPKERILQKKQVVETRTGGHAHEKGYGSFVRRSSGEGVEEVVG
jgi:hypothetical protein